MELKMLNKFLFQVFVGAMVGCLVFVILVSVSNAAIQPVRHATPGIDSDVPLEMLDEITELKKVKKAKVAKMIADDLKILIAAEDRYVLSEFPKQDPLARPMNRIQKAKYKPGQ